MQYISRIEHVLFFCMSGFRPPLGPRPGHRERERDHSSRSSRDREVYSRSSYERSSYERSLEHYDHGSSSYGSKLIIKESIS